MTDRQSISIGCGGFSAACWLGWSFVRNGVAALLAAGATAAQVMAAMVVVASIGEAVAEESRSVSWYLAHRAELARDYAQCQEHPSFSDFCTTVGDAKMRADADDFLQEHTP
jgi:hypothetical protein